MFLLRYTKALLEFNFHRFTNLLSEITKKQPVEGNDSSKQFEHTISLTPKEFEALSKLPAKKVRKIRYFFKNCEIDIFKDNLEGLVLIDFEFESESQKDNFQMPKFCLADVTQDDFIAGGMLAGKSYKDIEKNLAKFNYQKLGAENE